MGRTVVIIIVVLAFVAGSAAYLFIPMANTASVALSPSAPSKTETNKPNVAFKLNEPQAKPTEASMVEIDLENVPEIIAEVNGKSISNAIYIRTLKMIKENLGKAGQKLDKSMLDRMRREIVDNIINTEVLLRQAEKENIQVASDEVEKRFTRIQSNFKDQTQFEQTMKDQGLTVDELRAEITKSLRISTLLEGNVTGKVEVTDQNAKEYYELNQLEFEAEEKIHAAHILVMAREEAPADEKAKAKEKAEGLLKRIKAGESFDEIASKENDDTAAAARKGDLGTVGKSQFVPEFAQAAFALSPGDISDVIKSRFGYHIVKVIEKTPPAHMPYERVADQIKARLKKEKGEQLVRDYIEGLRQRMNVKVLI